jgi:Tesmin/TSO1-like CXC domain, cysteine-rich domain
MEYNLFEIQPENTRPQSPFSQYCLKSLPLISEGTIKATENNVPLRVATVSDFPLSGCNCVKTRCLKLYCECFANSRQCNESCNCKNCGNNENHEQRAKAITEAFERNPNAFTHTRFTCTRGCNCRRSGCRKRYCECYLNGVSCSAVCRCETCKNINNNNN